METSIPVSEFDHRAHIRLAYVYLAEGGAELAVQRMRNGKKLPPQWQRNQAEDLVAVIFPAYKTGKMEPVDAFRSKLNV